MDQLIEPIARQFDRLPPHSIDAEQCLLASMMLDKEMIGLAVQIIDRDSYFQADHQIIHDVLIKLYDQNRPIDAIIVRDELAKRQLLEEVGGSPYLGEILNKVPSAAHGEHYAKIVREKALLRQLIAASNDISEIPTLRTNRPNWFSTKPRNASSTSPAKKSASRPCTWKKFCTKFSRPSKAEASAASKPVSSSSTR